MVKLKRLVIDVLKPYEPSIVELAGELSGLEGVEGVNASLLEVDEEVENIKLTMEGRIDMDSVRDKIDGAGASIHSVDEVAAGDKLVNKVETPQD